MIKITKLKPLIFGRRGLARVSQTRSIMVKKSYRFLDTKRTIYPGIGATIIQTQPDPTRSAEITVILYPNGVMTYILGVQLLANQNKIYNLSLASQHERGYSNFLKNLPIGSVVHNVELIPGKGGKLAKSAGARAILLRKSGEHTLLRMKSGAERLVGMNCVGVSGLVGNQNHFLRNVNTAGFARLLGHKPHTRACSKNPVDHPLGGRTRGGAQPQNINGKLSGTPTARSPSHQLEILSARKNRQRKKG
jgi:large subunit ribosomal protein L2